MRDAPHDAASRFVSAPAGAPDAALLAAMQEQMSSILWTTDTDLRCRFASRMAVTHLGLRSGQSLRADTDVAAPLLEAHQRAIAGTQARLELATGGVRLSVVLQPLRDPAGAVIGVLGTAEDLRDLDEAAQAMFEQQQIFLTTLDHAPTGIAIWDHDGSVIYLNSMARQYTEADALGRPGTENETVWGVWHDEHGPMALENWPVMRVLRGEHPPAREMYKNRRDGRRQYIYFSVTPVHDAAGRLIAVVGTAADITELKRVESALRGLNEELEERVRLRTAALEQATRDLEREVAERQHALELLARSERLLSDVVNHSSTPIFLKDRAGRYLMVNRGYEELFGRTNSDMFGITDVDLFPADVAARLRANDQHVLREGHALQFEEVVPSERGERTYVSVKFPLYDEHGVAYGVGGIATDITERKEIEAALQSSRATLAAVIESSSDPIWAVDRELRLTTFNTQTARHIEALLGRAPRPGMPFEDDLPTEFREQWHERLTRALRGEPLSFTEAPTLNGVTRHLLTSLNPTCENGVVTGVAVISKDITDLVRAEEQVRQHQAELAHVLRLHTMGEMAASLAHEVNQPLGAIANYAQGCRHRMLAGAASSEDLLAVVEAIAAEALRAGEITRRVRELLRKESSRRDIADANDVVRIAARLTAPAARRAEVTLSVELAPQPLPVFADAIQVEQVIINLLVNAIEATAPCSGERRVEVRTRASATGVEVAVSDTGPGIDPHLGERIFEPFLTTKRDGLGMGLAISRSIIDAHDGALSAAANPRGGATFCVILPLAPID